jgi:hypothetical protein
MIAIDPPVRILTFPLASEGPFSNRASFVNSLFRLFVAAPGSRFSPRSERVRRNIWSEAQALQCPQRARMVLYAAQGPPAQPPAPSPRRATVPSEAMLRMDLRDSSGGYWLLGPAKWLARAPDAVHDHGEFPGKRYARLACT